MRLKMMGEIKEMLKDYFKKEKIKQLDRNLINGILKKQSNLRRRKTIHTTFVRHDEE
jgi:hypothetical protein